MMTRHRLVGGVCLLAAMGSALISTRAGSRVRSSVVTWKDAKGRAVNVVQASSDMKALLIADDSGAVWSYTPAMKLVQHVGGGAPLFATTDCTGPEYVDFNVVVPRAAFAMLTPTQALSYFAAPDDATPSTIVARSQRFGATCVAIEPIETAVTPLSRFRPITPPTNLTQGLVHPEFVDPAD